MPSPVERTFDQLVADCAEVTEELRVLQPVQPVRRDVVVVPEDVLIPDDAVSLVSGLGDYGD